MKKAIPSPSCSPPHPALSELTKRRNTSSKRNSPKSRGSSILPRPPRRCGSGRQLTAASRTPTLPPSGGNPPPSAVPSAKKAECADSAPSEGETAATSSASSVAPWQSKAKKHAARGKRTSRRKRAMSKPRWKKSPRGFASPLRTCFGSAPEVSWTAVPHVRDSSPRGLAINRKDLKQVLSTQRRVIGAL